MQRKLAALLLIPSDTLSLLIQASIQGDSLVIKHRIQVSVTFKLVRRSASNRTAQTSRGDRHFIGACLARLVKRAINLHIRPVRVGESMLA